MKDLKMILNELKITDGFGVTPEKETPKEKLTLKKEVLDWMEKEGGEKSNTEIRTFIFKRKGIDPKTVNKENRGRYSSYFSKIGLPNAKKSDNAGILLVPTKKDPRHLVRSGKKWALAGL